MRRRRTVPGRIRRGWLTAGISTSATAATLAVVLALSACGATEPQPGDPSARLACSDFRATAKDQTDGILTRAELRSRLQDVNDHARVSEEPGIPGAARDMLAAVTADNDPDLAAAVRSMGEACEAAGL